MRIIIANDLHNGTRHNIYKFALMFVTVVMICIMFRHQAELKFHYGATGNCRPGLADYILNIFGGMKNFTASESSQFEVPLPWMTIQLLISSCVFSYIADNMQRNGILPLILSGARTGWWIGKCIWAVSQVIIAYVCIFAGCMLTTFIGWGFDGFTQETWLHRDIIYAVAGVRVIDSALPRTIICYLVYPLIYNIAIAVMQITLQLFFNPIVSLAVIITYNVSSLFITSPFLAGNMALLYRNNSLTTAGISQSEYIAPVLMAAMVMCAAGAYIFNKTDIL